MNYYVDTCIYLNLWQKEGEATKGIPYWKLAKDFFEKCENEGLMIYYSGFVLKELSFTLSEEEFNQKQLIFKIFKRLYLSDNDLQRARMIEKEENYAISFYDIIHMILAKNSNSILITRDRLFLVMCKKYSVKAKRPEEIL